MGVLIVVLSISFILSYQTKNETSNLTSQLLQVNEKLQKLEERQKQDDNKIKGLKFNLRKVESSGNNSTSQIQEIKLKQEFIEKQITPLSDFSKQQAILNSDLKQSIQYLSELKPDVVKQYIQYLSELKLEVESIKKELIKAQYDILINGNYTNTQFNYHLNRIDEIATKVIALEKDQINILIKENNLTNQVNSNTKGIDQILGKVEVLEKDQKNIALNDNNLSIQVNSRIDQILIKVDVLEKEQKDILTNESSLTLQVNSNLNRIDQLTTQMAVLPLLSVKVDSLGLNVPAIQDSINSLNLKINSDTFNKVEMFGPYYPNTHEIQMTVTKTGYSLFPTVEPCILTLKGKAVVTLIATGHTLTQNSNAKISFMVNGKVNLLFTDRDFWQFGVQFSRPDYIPVNLTQEFMLEKGVYTFALAGSFAFNGSAILQLNAVSFVAKVTYVS